MTSTRSTLCGSGDLIINATRMFTPSYLVKGRIIREVWKQYRQWKIPSFMDYKDGLTTRGMSHTGVQSINSRALELDQNKSSRLIPNPQGNH